MKVKIEKDKMILLPETKLDCFKLGSISRHKMVSQFTVAGGEPHSLTIPTEDLIKFLAWGEK